MALFAALTLAGGALAIGAVTRRKPDPPRLVNVLTNLIASIVPGVLGIAGTLLFGWGMGICVLLSQGSTPVGVYNAVKPMLDEQKHPSTSIALIQKHTLI